MTTGLSVGGAERALHSLIKNGLQNEFTIEILSLTDLGHYGDKFKSIGIEVHCLYLRNPFKFLISFYKLLYLSWKFKPDIVQGWMYHGNIFSFLVTLFLFFKPKLFWGIRQSLYNINKEKFFTRIIIGLSSWLSPFVHTIIYNSKKSQIQHEIFGFSKSNGRYIPNGFDFSIWKKDLFLKNILRQELKIPSNSFVVGYVGRYHPMKNIELLLDSMVQILNQNSSVYLVVVGKNTDCSNLSIKHYYDNMPSNQFLSFGEIDDVQKLIHCIDLLCVTSSWGRFSKRNW